MFKRQYPCIYLTEGETQPHLANAQIKNTQIAHKSSFEKVKCQSIFFHIHVRIYHDQILFS